MKNKYEIRGDVTAIFIDSKKYGFQEVLIDTHNLQVVSEITNSWFLNDSHKTLYARGLIKNSNPPKRITMHRLIMDVPEGKVIDHININGLDNRESNMRIVTQAENSQNKKAQTNSKTGIRGVSWSKVAKKWRAQYAINRKKVNVGYFDDIEDARRAVERARRERMPYSQMDIS